MKIGVIKKSVCVQVRAVFSVLFCSVRWWRYESTLSPFLLLSRCHSHSHSLPFILCLHFVRLTLCWPYTIKMMMKKQKQKKKRKRKSKPKIFHRKIRWEKLAEDKWHTITATANSFSAWTAINTHIQTHACSLAHSLTRSVCTKNKSTTPWRCCAGNGINMCVMHRKRVRRRHEPTHMGRDTEV